MNTREFADDLGLHHTDDLPQLLDAGVALLAQTGDDGVWMITVDEPKVFPGLPPMNEVMVWRYGWDWLLPEGYDWSGQKI